MIIDRYTLGTFGNPYLTVARSSGTLTIDPDPSFFQMQIVLESGGAETVLNTVNGGIYFESNNYYFLDQDYSFTAGGIILEQYGTQVMSAFPSMLIQDTPDGMELQMFLYGITSEFFRISGIESVPVSIRLAGTSVIEETIAAPDILSLRINGAGEKAWYDHIVDLLASSGMVQGVDFTATQPADWDDPSDEVEVSILALNSIYASIGEMEVTV